MTVQKNIPHMPVPLPEMGDRPHGGLDLRSLLRIMIVRQRIILGTALAVVALTLVVVFNTTPQYDARAFVLLDQRQNRVIDVNAVLAGLATDPTSIENQLQILRSRTLMLHVIGKLGLDKKPVAAPAAPSLISTIRRDINPLTWLRGPSIPPTVQQAKDNRSADLVNELLGSETVTIIGRSSALQITYRASDPQKAADTANAIADAYVEDQLDAKFEATQKTSQWLADRLQELSSQMQSVDAAVQEYKIEHNITDTPTGGSMLDQELVQLNAQLVAARSSLAESQAKYAQVKQLQANGRAEDLSQIFQSGMIEQLRTQQAELLRQKAQYLTAFGPRHPKMLDLESQLKDIDGKINEEVNRVVATVANDVTVASAHVQSLQESLSKLEAEADVENKSRVKLTELQARSSSAHQLYEAFLGKFKETQGQQDVQTPDSRIISKAIIPTVPTTPNKVRDLEMALMGGLFLGFVLALGAERLDGGVRTVQQLENLINIPVLSTVPELVGVAQSDKQAADRVVEKPLSSFAEAIRGLQMALTHSNVDQRPKTILVTSSVPDEGKTTVALSLARVFARSDKKVLLIDCDFRKPSIAKALGIEDQHGLRRLGGNKAEAYNHSNGLFEVLSGEKSLEASLVPDPRSSVKCLLALRILGNPTDALGSLAMERLIAKVKSEWDVVILDSAPLLPVNDTKILARLVDAVAFVVRWEKTRREAVADAARVLVDISAPVTGVVITRADIRRYRYYSHGYQNYYSYKKYYTN